MSRFLKKILKYFFSFLGLYVLFILGAVVLNYDHPTDYPAAIIGKYQRLDSLKNHKKIIICGGSSSAYGIDSNELEKKFGLPVVNTGLAMSLGSFFHLNLTKDYLQKGDIVIYIPEYEYYYGNELGKDFLYTTFFYHPKMIKDFTWKQRLSMVTKSAKLSADYYNKKISEILRSKKAKKNMQYSRESYNQRGDNISLIKDLKVKIKEGKKTRFDQLKSKTKSLEFQNFLKEYANLCDRNEIKFLLGFPPIEKSQFDTEFLKEVESLQKELNVRYIGNPEDYVYPVDYFHDSSYHLNGLGRPKRTTQIINDLSKELE